MRILVTGSAGYIGTNFALRAVDKGHDVAGVDSFSEYYDPKIKRANAALLDRSGVRVQGRDLAVNPWTILSGELIAWCTLRGNQGSLIRPLGRTITETIPLRPTDCWSHRNGAGLIGL